MKIETRQKLAGQVVHRRDRYRSARNPRIKWTRFAKILLVSRASPDETDTYAQAIRIARSCNASLVVLHVLPRQIAGYQGALLRSLTLDVDRAITAACEVSGIEREQLSLESRVKVARAP